MLQHYAPGRVVAISLGFGLWHLAIVSDRIHSGRPLLISRRGVRNAVTEESWDTVVGNRVWRIATEVAPALHPWEIVTRARSRIGESGYDIWTKNCEHFARWACGLAEESTQVHKVVGLGVLAVLFFLAQE